MGNQARESATLPDIPLKRYFSIGEVGDLCAVKAHVLRYWEQEFPQLKPAKRRGNRRYYQYNDILLVREIRCLLYEQGFTISGARLKLASQKNEDTSPQLPLNRLVDDILSDLNALLVMLETDDGSHR